MIGTLWRWMERASSVAEINDRMNIPPIEGWYSERMGVWFYRDHHPSDEWTNMGIAPRPTTRLGRFRYDVLHGLIMRYPVYKVLLWSLRYLIGPDHAIDTGELVTYIDNSPRVWVDIDGTQKRVWIDGVEWSRWLTNVSLDIDADEPVKVTLTLVARYTPEAMGAQE